MTKKTNAETQRAFYNRMKAASMTRVSVWVHNSRIDEMRNTVKKFLKPRKSVGKDVGKEKC